MAHDTKPLKLFISHSGRRGHAIATNLRTALLDFGGPALECFLSPGDISAGDPWFMEMDAQLESCSACIVILDAAHWRSLWMPYELRSFTSTGRRVFPLRIGIDETEVKGPYLSLQTRELDRKSLRELFEYVAEDPRTNAPPLPEAVHDAWLDVERALESVLGNRVPYEDLIAQLRRTALDTGAGLHVSREELLGLDSYLETLEYTELSTALTSLGSDMRSLIDQSVESSGWGLVWREYGTNFLSEAARLIHVLAAGTLALKSQDRAREFWKNWIMVHTRSSIWTTNVPGTFGRSSDKDLLSKQEALIATNDGQVNVTRVFIYNADDDNDVAALRTTMKEQLQIGVRVLAITEHEFNWRVNPDQIAEIGSPDFMIIDDEYLYVTITPANRLGRVEFRANADELREARRIRDAIDSNADVVNRENIDRFPDVW